MAQHNHELLASRITNSLHGHRGVIFPNLFSLRMSLVYRQERFDVKKKKTGNNFNTGFIGKDVDNYLGNKRIKFC